MNNDGGSIFGDDDDDDEATKITKIPAKPPVRTISSGNAALVVVYVPMDVAAAQADLGRRIPIKGEVTIGRQVQSTLHLDQEDVSRRHASVLRENGVYVVKDLGARNGTALNDVDLAGATRTLKDGDRITIGSTILKFIQSDTENEFHEVIYRIKVEDALTRIHNKRFLMEFLERETARAIRHRSPMSFIIFDIDHFKKVNDTYGHLAGDVVLRETAARVKALVRKEECFARYGGEEFALVQPETSLAGATLFAEKIRRTIEASTFMYGTTPIRVTVSLGVAELEASMADATAFIQAADERLYAAKRGGRNRVVAG